MPLALLPTATPSRGRCSSDHTAPPRCSVWSPKEYAPFPLVPGTEPLKGLQGIRRRVHVRCGLRELWVCCGHSSARHRLPEQVDFPSSVSSRMEPAPRQVELKTPLRISGACPAGRCPSWQSPLRTAWLCSRLRVQPTRPPFICLLCGPCGEEAGLNSSPNNHSCHTVCPQWVPRTTLSTLGTACLTLWNPRAQPTVGAQ